MEQIDDLTKTTNEETFERILKQLITVDNDDADLKSDIKNPRNIALYTSFVLYLKKRFPKLNGFTEILANFKNAYIRLMFSFDRKSRQEIVEAFIAIAKARESNNQNNLIK